MLPSISKIFEYVIFDQLLKYFTSNCLFCSEQFGFRPGHSTELASSRFMNHIVQQMDQHHTPISIFLDMSKAFDTLRGPMAPKHDIFQNGFEMIF